ncbi:hypothetical protein VTL71DRAFT_3247 [Oculimacula yallundae]|uniref:Uncharacterized protein n=1 Tax=Oculimacula yallundae TaxID=86028 RepID=A0ABR4C7F7_9HELO
MALQLSYGVPRRYAALAIIILGTLWLWLAFDRPYNLPSYSSWDKHSDAPSVNHTPPVNHTSPAVSSFRTITDAFDFAPVKSESIKSVCDETQWNQSIVFKCDASVGGIGNIRNSILNCVRYAISAGAGLVIPTIVMRDEDNISIIRTGVNTEMSFMFDTQHFVESLKLSCPSLRLYPSVTDVENYELAPPAIKLMPEELVEGKIPATGIEQPQNWRGQFYRRLTIFPKTEAAAPYIVELGRSYLIYPIYSDGEGFALSFGSILKIRADARRLATKVLQILSEKYKFEADLTQPILKNSFFGVHLRTEKDAIEAWTTNDWVYSRFNTQAKLYLEQAPRSSPSVIYVASGNLTEIARFAANATAINLPVTTKSDLLTGSDLEELNALAWDQQALVDFLVMHKAADFAGIGHSSFAWNVALRRHTFTEERQHLDGPQMLSDELSQIYGKIRNYPEYAACLWP